MKKCKKCNQIKNLECFYKDNRYVDNFRPNCKNCYRLERKGRYLKNKEEEKEYRKKYYEKNKEEEKAKSRKYSKKYRKNNKKLIRSYNKKYYEKNKEYYRMKDSIRRIQKLNATFNNYEEEIREIYKNCPEGCEVDHIHPLINKNVCGLHVPWNLQYLTKKENQTKKNKFDGTIDNDSWKKE